MRARFPNCKGLDLSRAITGIPLYLFSGLPLLETALSTPPISVAPTPVVATNAIRAITNIGPFSHAFQEHLSIGTGCHPFQAGVRFALYQDLPHVSSPLGIGIFDLI